MGVAEGVMVSWLKFFGGLLSVLVLTMAVSACALETGNPADSDFEPRPGKVEEMEPFHAFVDTQPTPTEFERVYPDVTLVLPGDIATQEYRTDNSRFFAELDDDGRIVDGEFR